MADEQSTAVDETVDTSVSEDTSTDDASLEDIEVDLADIQDDDDEAEESEEESEFADESSDEEAETEESEEAETELSDEQKQAAQNKEMYDRRQAEKQARIARINQDQADYIAESAENRDPLELAVRQLQVSEYNNTVDAMSNKLTNEYQKAIVDFPVLATQDPVIQAEIDAAIDAFQSQHVTIDAYGNPTQVRGDLYATLQAKADSIEKLTGIRATRQEKSKTKEKSKTLTTPTRAPKQPKVDPDMAAFDEEAYS